MHRQKWRNCRSHTLLAVIFKHFYKKIIKNYKNYKCVWKGTLVDYILLSKSGVCFFI